MKPDIKNLAEQWRIHRKNLDDLEIRKAKYGLDAPISLLRQMDDEKMALAELERRLQQLGRSSGETDPANPPQSSSNEINITGDVYGSIIIGDRNKIQDSKKKKRLK